MAIPFQLLNGSFGHALISVAMELLSAVTPYLYGWINLEKYNSVVKEEPPEQKIKIRTADNSDRVR